MALSYITNGVIRIGLDLSQGATIYSISKAPNYTEMLEVGGEGIVCALWGHDLEGDGSTVTAPGEEWNPNQTGNVFVGELSSLNTYTLNSDSFYASIATLDFRSEDGYRIDGEVTLEVWFDFVGDTFRARYKATYTGTEDRGIGFQAQQDYYGDPDWFTGWSQEFPAGYFNNATLVNSHAYTGTIPWSYGGITNFGDIPTRLSGYELSDFKVPTEYWTAITNANGDGIGVFAQNAAATIIADLGGATGLYLTPVSTHNFSISSPTYDATVYYAIGTVNEIRDAFYAVYRGTKILVSDGTVTLSSWDGATIYYKFDSYVEYEIYSSSLSIANHAIIEYYADDGEYQEPVNTFVISIIYDRTGTTPVTIYERTGSTPITITRAIDAQ